MKPLFTTIALSLCSCIASSAATITVTNFSDGVLTPFLGHASLNTLSSGIAVIGTFPTEPTSVTDVLGSFVQAGDTSDPTTSQVGVMTPGFFNGSIQTGALIANDGLVGNQVYVVVGDGTTLANSTGLAVWKATSNGPSGTDNTFTADNPVGGPDTVTVLDSKGSLIIGTRVAAFDAGQGDAPAFQLAAIPEPSTVLLSALGVLALLRRRR